MRYFKEILHMEESIVNEENRDTVKRFQRSITYRWWHGSYQKPWQNDDITDKIIKKIVEENGFVRNHSDVEELESSEDEDQFGKVKKLVKRMKGEENVRTEGKVNLMLEKEIFEYRDIIDNNQSSEPFGE
ncbi:unnamed protein product [Rhizophagus irregularis]|nr:unnamed protein product [Rhizophagus irregularis]